MTPSYSMVYKVVILGDSGVGKSNIHSRLVSGTFSDTPRQTIGVDFSVKKFTCGPRQVTLQLWDTAGQERFRSLAVNTYLKHSDGVVLVYDVTERRTFNNVLSWKHEVDSCPLVPRGVPAILVGNKSDLRETRQVAFEEGLQLADSHSMMFTECSAKRGGRPVELVFTLLVGEIDRLQMNSPEMFDTSHIDCNGLSQDKVSHKKSLTSTSQCKSSSGQGSSSRCRHAGRSISLSQNEQCSERGATCC